MNALLRKEIRLILPAWVVAMMLATLPVFGLGGESGYAFFALGLGLLSLGLAPFGQEFSSGTFTILLAQPVPRVRIWRTKVAVLAFALVFVWEVFLLCFWSGPMLFRGQTVFRSESLVVGGLLLMVAFSGGLWTTLLFRQVAAGLWFTLLVPASLWVAVGMLFPSYSTQIIRPVLVIYSIAGFVFAQWLFLHAQDAQWTGGSVALPAWLSLGARTRSAKPAAGHSPLRALIRKEFQSHHVSLLIAAGMLLVHLAVIGVRRFTFAPSDPHNTLHSLLEFWWVLWFGLPFLVGSTAVAEERKLGTLEPQLCLPTTRRAQFAIKVVVALVLGIFLGGVMPVVTEAVCGFGVVPGTFRNDAGTGLWQPLLLTCSVAGAITVVSFYASTFTRNLLQAMGLAVVVGLALMAFGTWALQEAFGGFGYRRLWVGPLVAYIGKPTLVVTVLWLAFRNFKHVHVGFNVWRRNLLSLLGAMAFIVVTTTLIYNRAWELFMTLEPKHGPARLRGAMRAKLLVGRTYAFAPLADGRHVGVRRIFVLLPDGRLWVPSDYRFEASGEYMGFSNRTNHTERVEELYLAVPVAGAYLDTSNWVSLAGSFYQVVGLQSDGSLWNIFSAKRSTALADLSTVLKPERIGSDSNWKAIAAGRGHVLALKQDGTLWGWGYNDSGQLGSGPKALTNGPVRIGADSDWNSIFATMATSVGVKRDGSVWMWGGLRFGPRGSEKGWERSTHPTPVRWDLDGADWEGFEGNGNGCDLILKRDGSLWAMGYLPADLLGHHLLGKNYDRRFTAKPVRVGSDSDWTDLSVASALLALKRTGAIYENPVFDSPLACWGDPWKPSRYSDWQAIGTSWWSSFVALAADGTLCAWRDPVQQAQANLDAEHQSFGLGLLGPSRKPVWSVNIFADAATHDRSPPAQP